MVVAGLVDGARIGFAVLPDERHPGDDPKVLRITSTNAETQNRLGFTDDLVARAAGTIDAFVEGVRSRRRWAYRGFRPPTSPGKPTSASSG